MGAAPASHTLLLPLHATMHAEQSDGAQIIGASQYSDFVPFGSTQNVYKVVVSIFTASDAVDMTLQCLVSLSLSLSLSGYGFDINWKRSLPLVNSILSFLANHTGDSSPHTQIALRYDIIMH